MILHLLTDDKFADYAIAQFSAPEMESEFVVVPTNDTMELVKRIDQCSIIPYNSLEFADLLTHIDRYSAIMLHGLFGSAWQQEILNAVPASVKVAWVFWGGEIYSRKDQFLHFLAPLTKIVCRLHAIWKSQKATPQSAIPLEDFRRIDYCITDEKEEYEYAKQYTGASFDHLWYSYYSLEETIGSLMDKRYAGNIILVGNSSSIKNNHFDMLYHVFRNRRLLKNSDSQLIVPLSYGEPWVKNLVKRIGRWMFGERFHSLDTYLAREEYNAMLTSCSTMILGYTQPAGQGNIITGLWLGMRVYLSEQSITYHYFKRLGCKVYSMESELNKYGYEPMSEQDIAHNRSVLRAWYGKERVEEGVRNIANTLNLAE